MIRRDELVNFRSLFCCPPPPPFFLYFWTDGWSSTASPTTPSCLYIFHIVETTLKCTLSLGCRYFQLLGLKCADYHILKLCTTLFHFIILQRAYLVKIFDTLSNVLLLRFQLIRYPQSLKCLLSYTLLVAGRRRQSSRAYLLFIFYRAPIVSDFHSVANTPSLSVSLSLSLSFTHTHTSNLLSTTAIKPIEGSTPI